MSLTGLLFLTLFAAGCILAFARHPIFGLCTYVAVFYLHPPARWWGQAIPDLRWAFLAAILTVLAVLLRRNDRMEGAGVPLLHNKVVIGILVFVAWIAIKYPWALDPEQHSSLLILYIKYFVLIALIYKCVETEEHIRLFLWTHVLGCAYLGWIAYTEYTGGRFEGFGSAGINEANSAALQIVTGVVSAAALFLTGSLRDKAVLTGTLPFIVNALITTISRSGFLAALTAGIVFNWLAPRRFRTLVNVLSILGIALFVSLTNPTYWARIASLKQAGEQVQGIDTGYKRLVLIDAQFRMFSNHPLGCGHRCTAVLSPDYLTSEHLVKGGRSSHNTFMTLLVEHGIPGAILYVVLVGWLVKTLIFLARFYRQRSEFYSTVFPAIAASLCAIFIGDMFVDYLISEARIWFIALLLVLSRHATEERSLKRTSTPFELADRRDKSVAGGQNGA